MSLSQEEFLKIEARNNRRKSLRAELTVGPWTYDSFAWIEPETTPWKERPCILIRRRAWFDSLMRRYGENVLDEGTTEGKRIHAIQPARDGLYIESALNDPIEEDIAKLLAEVRGLRSDLPPPPSAPETRKRSKPRKPRHGRATPEGSLTGQPAIFDTEWEFREWLEDNLDRFGFKRVFHSQEVCPDYFMEGDSGKILRVEAELFATNFIHHGHSPRDVDVIVACFASEDEISGVPVLAANDLREYAPSRNCTELATEQLSNDEKRILGIAMMSGGMEMSALAQSQFSGNLIRFQRVAPDEVAKLKGRRSDDSIFTTMREETRKYIRRFHHVLLGAGLNEGFCRALEGLEAKGLTALRPLALISARYDGALIDHEGWLPTEVYPTAEAYRTYSVDIRGRLKERNRFVTRKGTRPSKPGGA